MPKYHMSEDGVPKICNAKIQCRLKAETEHFDGTLKEAEKWAIKINDQNFSSIQSLSKKKENTVKIDKYSVPEKFEKEFEYVYNTVHNNFDEIGGLGEEFSEKTLDIVYKYMKQTKNMIPSRTRVVFMEKDTVVKIPITEEGMLGCGQEKQASDNYKLKPDDYIPIADTEIIEEGDVFYARMEKVKPLVKVDYRNLPFWVSMVDCGQVGYTKNNVLVAYDL